MNGCDQFQHRTMARVGPWARKRGRLAGLEPTTGRASEQRCRPRRIPCRDIFPDLHVDREMSYVAKLDCYIKSAHIMATSIPTCRTDRRRV